MKGVPGDVVVVCVLADAPTPFTDNERGRCAACGVAVQHRPHIPRPSRLICPACFEALVEPGDVMCATARTLAELDVLARRN